MLRTFRPLFSTMAIILATLALGACKKERDQNHAGGPGGGMPPAAVEVLTVQPERLPVHMEYSGRTQGSREVEVRARVKGILLQRKYTEGSFVHQNDVLFQIDPAPYDVALQLAHAKLQEATARMLSAQRDWDRTSGLFSKKAVSEKQRDDTLSELDMAKANVASAQAEVNAAQIDMTYTSVMAPITGITSREAVSEGSLVGTGAGDSLLTRITQLDPIYVTFAYPDADFIRQRDQIAQGELEVEGDVNTAQAEMVLGDGTVYNQKGTISFTDTVVDRDTGTVQARVVFPNPDSQVLPGQFVRIRPLGITRNDVIVIPEKAVMQGPQGKFVYVVDEKNTAQIVPVQTGYSYEGRTVVEQGLKSGDRIITDGVIRVMPGVPVQPTEAAVENPDAPPQATGDVSAGAGESK